MKKYRNNMPTGFNLAETIAYLTTQYKLYNIKFSDNNFKTTIGEVVLQKIPAKDLCGSFMASRHSSASNGVWKAYTGYKVGFTFAHEENMRNVLMDKDDILFHVIDELDGNCYDEYQARQKRANRLLKIAKLFCH